MQEALAGRNLGNTREIAVEGELDLGTKHLGGLAGVNEGRGGYGIIGQSYSIGDVRGVMRSDNTETAERITVSSFLNWDFNIWQMDDGNWPTLQ